MPVPDGATGVTYDISTVDDEPYLSLRFEVPVSPSAAGEIADAAAQAAADRVLTALVEQYPDAQVRAERRYTGSLPGNIWSATTGTVTEEA